ncbi:hypothetical protein AP3564_09130 [Aeribacillus pallidus]|uniref:Uncharacterized protein n=1 Tax=Aeribacillus pallidus TaxID=33936 RepID=A0A223E544_9BACI|nr:hypothetical protein AP3564_09130 [Aeribacillus pallidus]
MWKNSCRLNHNEIIHHSVELLQIRLYVRNVIAVSVFRQEPQFNIGERRNLFCKKDDRHSVCLKIVKLFFSDMYVVGSNTKLG